VEQLDDPPAFLGGENGFWRTAGEHIEETQGRTAEALGPVIFEVVLSADLAISVQCECWLVEPAVGAAIHLEPTGDWPYSPRRDGRADQGCGFASGQGQIV
jgi:hypothetical protein